MQRKSSNIWESYNNFYESGLVKRRFGYDEFLPVVRRHNTRFREHLEGLSAAGRAIYSYTIGNGRTTVLLWRR